MKKIALTGGIGTGKTFISKEFIKKGIPVFYADEEAKKLYSRPDVLSAVRAAFGDVVFDNQQLSFAKLSNLVFQNQDEMAKLEAIIHPLVMQEFEKWAEEQHAETVMMESAIIFESHLDVFFDHIITVNASIPVRIARIKRRNPELSDIEILKRINAQLDQETKCKLSDEVIEHEIDW